MSEEQTESSFAEDTEHPPEFVCPITMEIMKDPVVAGDGISYERRAITQWLLSKHHSPMTGLPFSSKSVVTNQNLRSLIERHLDEKKGHGSKDSLPIDSKRLRFTHRTFYEKPLQAIVGKQLLDWYQVDIHRHPPHASYYCAHACTSGLLVYIGGYHGVDMESQSIIRMYDTATCTWSLFPLHVIPISAFTAVTFGVEIFAFGGMIALPSSGGLPRPTNHVWSLNLRNEEFAQITTSGSIPRPVFNATTVLIGEKMFVFGGGHHAHGPNNDVYALNLKTYVWEKCEVNGDIPEPRLYHNAVAHGNDMYIFGGAPDVKTTEGRDIIFGDLYCLHTGNITRASKRISTHPCLSLLTTA
eukprot:TRINITY_DN8092_c0_g1_i2.p1 TRINITY_DN8092_c0_g1~~TRINITY_DN8092_c0_g1_i2.p1  ORF type:complete len:356 (-),score=61.93 TRINITY_DN8092_c0_g1_i2:461-1528(-)